MIINTIVDTTVETVLIQEEVNPTTIIVTSETPQVLIAEGEPGPQGIQGETGPQATISTASDVDISNITNGSLLIFSTASQKWVANTLLENQSLESGHY